MAYANGFNGDQIQLPVIVKTLEAKLYIRPGITCNPDISITARGEALYYYIRGASTVTKGTAGSKHTYISTGVTKETLPFVDCENIDAVIPGVNYQTVSADIVGDKVVQETIKAANNINEDFITKLVAGANASTTVQYDSTDPYGSLLKLRADFVTTNKAFNIKPTACFVASDIFAALLAKNVIIFKDGTEWGNLLGFSVIECPDLDSGTAVMLNAVGMIAAQNVNNLVVVDASAAGFPAGTLITGEIVFANAPTVLEAGVKPIFTFKAAA